MIAETTHSSPIGLRVRPIRWFLETESSGGGWRAQLTALLPYAAGYVFLHGALVMLGLLISTVPTEAVAIWFAVGFLCTVLAVTPRRTWPLWILCSILGRIFFELLVIDNRSLLAPITFSMVNVLEAVCFALLMQKPIEQAYGQGRPLYLSTAMIISAIIVANLGGFVGSWAIRLLNLEVVSYWESWRVWAAGDFIGIVLLAPAATWFMLPQLRMPRNLARWPENAAMLFLLLIFLSIAIFLSARVSTPYAGAANVGLATLLVFPILWAALRAEFPMVALLQLLLAIAIILTASYGLGPFAHDIDNYLPALAAMQLFLISTVLVVTNVSFAVLEWQRAQFESNLHQRFSDMIVSLTSRLIDAGSSRLDKVIAESLNLIGSFSQADRCVLMQTEDDGATVSATHRWAADGVDEYALEFPTANLGNFPWITEQFRSRGYLIFNKFDRVLPEGAEELDVIRQAMPDSVSAVYIGLFADERLVGAIGYGYLTRNIHWSNESLSLMYLVGQLFANIVRRKRSEQELELYRKRLRTLTKDMAVADERTRRRTAVDLHDTIGQNLAVARMKAGKLLAQFDNLSELTHLRNLIDDALRGTRYLIADLSPTILYELGLVPALQSLAERFALANDIECEVEEVGMAWQPDNDLGIALYRAVQQCLNNISRHAQAAKATIRVSWGESLVDIEVIDDGIGFDEVELANVQPHGEGFGLFSLREGVNLMGGQVRITSARGLGTTVRISVPRHTTGTHS